MARRLSEAELLHLVRLASGCLVETDGDVEAAMGLALERHFALIEAIKTREIVSDLGPGNAILYVPESGGLAIRLERHAEPTEEAPYPEVEVDLMSFEVFERADSYGNHRAVAPADVDLSFEDWD